MGNGLSLLTMSLLAASVLAPAESASTYAEYVELGEYKGIEVMKILTEVTDETLQEEIDMILEEYAEQNEITDRAAQEGDLVSITYTGVVDGEEIDSTADEGYELTLGDGYLSEEIENGIIGMSAGESKDITLTLTEDYGEELSGQEAVYTVTLDAIYETILPEYNDEFVSGISDFSTTAEYEEDLRSTLYEDMEESNSYIAASDALYAVIENSTFSGYPEELYNQCKEVYDEQNAMYAEMFGMDVEDFELSEEDTQAAVEEMVYEEMVIDTIALNEGLEVTEEEYTAYLTQLASDYGYESSEEFEELYGKDAIVDELLISKVQDFLLENASVTEVTEDEYYEAYYDTNEDISDEDIEEIIIDEEDLTEDTAEEEAAEETEE